MALAAAFSKHFQSDIDWRELQVEPDDFQKVKDETTSGRRDGKYVYTTAVCDFCGDELLHRDQDRLAVDYE